METEQRKYKRRNLGIAARVTWPSPLPCLVADVSESGAQLRSKNIDKLPDTFDLALTPDIMRKCHVVWRKRDQIGISFLPQPTVTHETRKPEQAE